MRLSIEIPDEFVAALKAKAQAEGVSPDRFASRILQSTLSIDTHPEQPFETGYGIWAKYGPAPTIEEISENRREMFRNFPRDVE